MSDFSFLYGKVSLLLCMLFVVVSDELNEPIEYSMKFTTYGFCFAFTQYIHRLHCPIFDNRSGLAVKS